MIKGTIVLMVFSVVVIMISGMKMLENNYYWRNQYLLMHLDYAKNRLAYFEYKHNGIVNWIKNKNSKKDTPEKQSREKTGSIPILLYHGVIKDKKWKPDGVNISLSDFQKHMFALKKAGYQTINIEDYVAFSKGEKDFPPKVFLLTFDDGRKDSYYPVDPILRTLNFTAVMHVITGRSLGEDNENGVFHLSEQELKKMITSGRWEMESHGKDDHELEVIDKKGKKGHFLSNKLWLEEEKRLETKSEYKTRIEKDLLSSKKELEKKLNISALAFAYPFGDYGQATVNLPESKEILVPLANSIFPITFYQAGSSEFPVNYKGEDLLLAKRINVGPEMSADKLLWLIEKTQAKKLNYADNFSSDNGWMSGWGLISILKNTLLIGATNEEDSALTFLGGSYLWEDYLLQADVRVKNGNAFTLNGRYKNGNNYISCNYYSNRIVLQQRTNGTDYEEIDTSLATGLGDTKKTKVGISIIGNTANCFLNGEKVLTSKIDPTTGHGGISFNIWNSIPEEKAYLLINNLQVSKAF